MVNAKVIILVLLVLPAIIFGAKSSSCKVSITQTQTATGKYNTYSATATNTGSASVSNVLLTPSATLKSLDGLTASGNAYMIASLAAGKSTIFSYKVKTGTTVTWSSTCASSTSTTAPSTTGSKATSAPGTTGSKATSAPSTTGSKATTAPSTTGSKATTAAPTNKATTAAPNKATTSPSTNGRICPAGSWWAPSPLTTWQWQLTGTIDQSVNAQMFDIDLFDNTAATISALHAKGKVVICYFSTQYENWRPDASSFPAAAIGNGLDGWAGENYVDIRATSVRNAMVARLNLAVSKGCDGVEPDNVDGYTASSGFPLTANDQISFNTFIANQAHALGLSVGLKNDVDQAKALQPVFDWALNEQCHQYGECDTLTPFVTAGKAVFNCEYSGSGATVCADMNKLKFSSLIKTLDLTASIKAQCCTYLSPSCSPAPYTCKTSASARDVRGVEIDEAAEQQQQEAIANEFNAQNFASAASSTYASVLVLAAVVLVALNF